MGKKRNKHVIVISILLFIVGVLWYPVTRQNWLHELGHITAAYLTGGSGGITSGRSVQFDTAHPTFVYIAGAMFSLLLGAVALLVTSRKRIPLYAAFLWGKAHLDVFLFINSFDHGAAGISIGAWLGLTMPVLVATWCSFIIILINKYGQKHKKHAKIVNNSIA
jgi:hypothetical protein